MERIDRYGDEDLPFIELDKEETEEKKEKDEQTTIEDNSELRSS